VWAPEPTVQGALGAPPRRARQAGGLLLWRGAAPGPRAPRPIPSKATPRRPAQGRLAASHPTNQRRAGRERLQGAAPRLQRSPAARPAAGDQAGQQGASAAPLQWGRGGAGLEPAAPRLRRPCGRGLRATPLSPAPRGKRERRARAPPRHRPRFPEPMPRGAPRTAGRRPRQCAPGAAARRRGGAARWAGRPPRERGRGARARKWRGRRGASRPAQLPGPGPARLPGTNLRVAALRPWHGSWVPCNSGGGGRAAGARGAARVWAAGRGQGRGHRREWATPPSNERAPQA
jgi:hypothetical protein